MTVDELLGRLDKVKRSESGDYWKARCPAHEDKAPSLSISEGDDGNVLLKCHAGCTLDAILGALRLEPADLFAKNGNGRRLIVATYDYTDEHGTLLFQVCRRDDKQFPQRRPDGNGGWVWGLGNVRRVLYRLPQVLEASAAGLPVYVVEGEKDVHAIERVGAVATCNPMGAGKWRSEYADSLAGARVVIVADRDDAGVAHARAVAATLPAATTAIVQAAEGKDAHDHLAAGHGLDDFQPLDDAPSTSARLSLRGLDTYRIRKVQWLDKPFLQRSAFHLLAGRKGVLKGTYACGLSARTTCGELYPEPKQVLVVTSEDSIELDFLPRLVAAGGNPELVKILNGPFLMPDDLPWLQQQAHDLGDVGLIVIDPIGNHLGGADTDKEGLVRNAIAPLNPMADELDCMILGVRHLGKDASRGALASVLGSTAWVDVPRAVILMAADDEDDLLFHAQVVAGNRGPRNSGRALRLELVDVPPAVEITLAVPAGDSAKNVEDLLGATKAESRSSQARDLILDTLESEGDQESDALDALVAQTTGLAVKTIKNTRVVLKDEGLIKSYPEKDELGSIVRWMVGRTKAPRL